MQAIQPYQQYMYSYPHKTAYGPLQDIHMKDYISRLSGRKNSLYFHIPFCQYKCGYCNLFSVVGQPEQRIAAYIDAMERQSEQLAGLLPADASFTELALGGGTPLLLPEPLLERVFLLARNYFRFDPDGHSVSVETSPNQTTKEKLLLLKRMGVSRVSIGVQSFQEEELAVLRRFHTAEAARQALRLIRETGFSCLNIDLIYGIKGQTIESLTDSLKQAFTFQPEELFVYPLYVQPGTYLYRHGVSRQEDALQMYRHVRDFLCQAGYVPYSMRRFVKAGRTLNASAAKQQTACTRPGDDRSCGFGNTLSIGCGGRSYLGNLHFCTPYAVRQEQCLSILTDYMERKDYLQITHGYLLSEEEEKRRYVIRHILFGRGICCADYQEHFGKAVLEDFPLLLEWADAGYALAKDGFVALTEEGFALSDYLGPQLMSEEVRSVLQYR